MKIIILFSPYGIIYIDIQQTIVWNIIHNKYSDKLNYINR